MRNITIDYSYNFYTAENDKSGREKLEAVGCPPVIVKTKKKLAFLPWRRTGIPTRVFHWYQNPSESKEKEGSAYTTCIHIPTSFISSEFWIKSKNQEDEKNQSFTVTIHMKSVLIRRRQCIEECLHSDFEYPNGDYCRFS